MNIPSNLLAFVFVVGVIIFVHELGHYLVAKAFGVTVRTFSLGFGPRLWGFRKGPTDYRIAVVPLGGYVAFAGQDPTEPASDPGDFLAHPRWQRILILFAGPAMNVVLAVLLVAFVYMLGTDIGNQRDLSTEIGLVAEGSPAEAAGLRRGDRIVEIDGKPVKDWQEVSMATLTSPGRELHLVYERAGELLETTLVPAEIPKYELGEAGIYPSMLLRVAGVMAGSPAERAGFRYGDVLLAVDGHSITMSEEFTAWVEPRIGQEVAVQVDRDGQRLLLHVVPEKNKTDESKGAIGIYIGRFQFQRFGPLEAFRQSVRYNLDTVVQIVIFIDKILERRISPQSAIGGPIEIAVFSGEAARSGFRQLFFLMALISLNLFLLNLLPIPILDGGQILVLLIESTLRRDLSIVFKERLTQAGLVVIVTLMAMALYFDLAKNLPRRGVPDGEPVTEDAP